MSEGLHGWDALQRDALEAMGYTLYRHTAPALPALPDEPLLHALLRACDRDAATADARELVDSWGDIDALRSAAMKRALWPRLRHLRGDHAS